MAQAMTLHMSKSLTLRTCILTTGLVAGLSGCAMHPPAPAASPKGDAGYGPSLYLMHPDAEDLDPALRKRLPARASLRVLVEILGPAHGDTCSGVYCPIWYFSDGQYVHAGQTKSGWSWGVSACESTPCIRRSPFEKR